MLIKTCLLLTALVLCDCALYSSFWAPLFNPKILNYRVDVNFDPNAGRSSRDEYIKNYGYRGEKLIADLGNHRGIDNNIDYQVTNGVKFYYTYPGADN